MIDKEAFRCEMIALLRQESEFFLDSARKAHAVATDEENIPDNKYDTLSLEASYLAQGNADRARQLRSDIDRWRNLSLRSFAEDSSAALGALVKLREGERTAHLFLGPCSGGTKVSLEAVTVTVVTPQSPLGKALLGKEVGDEVRLALGGREKCWELEALF